MTFWCPYLGIKITWPHPKWLDPHSWHSFKGPRRTWVRMGHSNKAPVPSHARKSIKNTQDRENHGFLMDVPRKTLSDIRDVCEVLMTSRPFFYINTHIKDRVFASWRLTSSTVDEAIQYTDWNFEFLSLTMVWLIWKRYLKRTGRNLTLIRKVKIRGLLPGSRCHKYRMRPWNIMVESCEWPGFDQKEFKCRENIWNEIKKRNLKWKKVG